MSSIEPTADPESRRMPPTAAQEMLAISGILVEANQRQNEALERHEKRVLDLFGLIRDQIARIAVLGLRAQADEASASVDRLEAAIPELPDESVGKSGQATDTTDQQDLLDRLWASQAGDAPEEAVAFTYQVVALELARGMRAFVDAEESLNGLGLRILTFGEDLLEAELRALAAVADASILGSSSGTARSKPKKRGR